VSSWDSRASPPISLPRGGIEGVEAWGVALIVVASVSWAFGSYLSPRLVTGELQRVDAASVELDGWFALAYLVIVGSIIGYTAYVYLLSHAPLSLVGTYAYVNPVVAVFLGWLILSEPLTGVVIAGGLLVVLGVALVVRGERPRTPQSDPMVLKSPTKELTTRS
jgi:drug/metabolite transporter (DMT)-like permease